MGQQKDMTAGNPGKIIFEFTLPVFIGNVFQQFYNMADAMIVGKFVGTGALAAVGSTGTIMFLILGFVLGMTAGVTVLTAQKFGFGDMKAMRKTVGSAVILSMAVSVLLTAASMAFMKPLLRFMQTPQDIFKDAYVYIMIICAGIFAQMLYNLLASILRAIGNSRVPLYFLILAALLNIVLDLLFIIVFQMKTAGAAIATYSAQNMGAGNIKRIRQGFRSVTVMGCIYSVVIGVMIAFAGKYMTYLFVSGNVTVIMGLVDTYLKCIVVFLIPLMVVNVYRNGIQGMGYGIMPMMAGVAELIGRGVAAVIAARKHSYAGVCLASPAAWVLVGGLLLVMYFYIMKHNEERFGTDRISIT